MIPSHKLSASIVIRTEGQRLLRMLQCSDTRIAQACGVSRVLCSGWRTGRTKPGLEKRRIIRELYDIPINTWDEKPISVEPIIRNTRGETLPPKRSIHRRPFNPKTYVPPPELEPAHPLQEVEIEDEMPDEEVHELARYGSKHHDPLPSTREGVEQLLVSLRTARKKPDLLSTERVKLAQAETRAYALLQRMDKDNELSEDRIVRQHPKWAQTRETILGALKPFPDASKAVIDALRKLEGAA